MGAGNQSFRVANSLDSSCESFQLLSMLPGTCGIGDVDTTAVRHVLLQAMYYNEESIILYCYLVVAMTISSFQFRTYR